MSRKAFQWGGILEIDSELLEWLARPLLPAVRRAESHLFSFLRAWVEGAFGLVASIGFGHACNLHCILAGPEELHSPLDFLVYTLNVIGATNHLGGVHKDAVHRSRKMEMNSG